MSSCCSMGWQGKFSLDLLDNWSVESLPSLKGHLDCCICNFLARLYAGWGQEVLMISGWSNFSAKVTCRTHQYQACPSILSAFCQFKYASQFQLGFFGKSFTHTPSPFNHAHSSTHNATAIQWASLMATHSFAIREVRWLNVGSQSAVWEREVVKSCHTWVIG
jgi:hypothetical protein